MDIKKHIIDEFSSKGAQKRYRKAADDGLWGSEELIIKKYFKKGSKVLDIGCGAGRTTIPLHKMGYKVIGIDLTPAMIHSAKTIAESKKLKIKYEIGDATKLRFKDATFDNALFSFNGWTQIPGKENRLQALKEILRVLKPGGHFYFTTHLRKMRGWTLFWTKQWLRFFILKNLGFNIDEMDFGDRFFERETCGTKYNTKQYIHIPSLDEAKNQIKKAGFKLVMAERGVELSPKDTQPSPMIYVCRK